MGPPFGGVYGQNHIDGRLGLECTPQKWVQKGGHFRGLGALFGTPFWRGIWAEITLTPVWGSNVTMGFWAILGYPILGVPLDQPLGQPLGYPLTEWYR